MLHAPTLFPLLGYLDDQCGEFLKLWLYFHGFGEIPDLIEYFTTIGNGTILKDDYTAIGNPTLLKDFDYLVYLTQLKFFEDTLNQIIHMLSTLILWSKYYYTTICQYATLYDFFTIS